VWGTGPYQNITEGIADLHEAVVRRLRPAPGQRWLDVACGTGALAERAAKAGADVTGLDLAPALIETAKERAAAQGLAIDYQVGDCERLPFGDGEFDVVGSTCGIMFAPDHRATAAELARVTRSGGRLGLANWRPDSTMARLFGVMRPFMPPPPEGAGVPFRWGSEEHVQELLGDAFELEFDEGVSPIEAESEEAFWELWSGSYGPTRVLAESLDEDRRGQLRQGFMDLAAEHRANGIVHMPRRYLLVVGTRR
jgi:SAM-dependent methyltransferase